MCITVGVISALFIACLAVCIFCADTFPFSPLRPHVPAESALMLICLMTLLGLLLPFLLCEYRFEPLSHKISMGAIATVFLLHGTVIFDWVSLLGIIAALFGQCIVLARVEDIPTPAFWTHSLLRTWALYALAVLLLGNTALHVWKVVAPMVAYGAARSISRSRYIQDLYAMGYTLFGLPRWHPPLDSYSMQHDASDTSKQTSPFFDYVYAETN